VGTRFPDMSEAYDKKLRRMAMEIAKEKNIKLHMGLYVGVQGPTFETPAEFHFFRTIGGDAVGMSTVPEVYCSQSRKMIVLAFSIITDLGVIGKIVEVSHEDVQESCKNCPTQNGCHYARNHSKNLRSIFNLPFMQRTEIATLGNSA
jgi:purine-nucleoside phosphorylase